LNPSAPLAIEWIDSPWLRAGRALAWTLALISVAIRPIELALRVPLVLLLAAIGLVSLRRELHGRRRALWHDDGRIELLLPEPGSMLRIHASSVVGPLICLHLRDLDTGKAQDWLFLPGSCHDDLLREIRWRARHLRLERGDSPPGA
jgi:hypothetical protein